MQTTSATMLTALQAHEIGTNSFDLLELIEIYASSYVPHVTNGFEPASAEKRWCGVLGYTFLTLAYEREYVDRGDIQRFMSKQENNVTLNFSNISRQLAAWVQGTDIEGKQLVVRVVCLSSTVLADSLVIFTGRLDKPGDFSDESGSISATQRFGQINQQFPPRTFSPNDPNGRAPNDPLFEGFRFSAQTASVIYTTRVRRQGFGGLVGLSRNVTHSFQASSRTDISSNLAVPDAFGRVQLYATYLATLDIGGAINFSAAVCEGVIDSYIDIKQINPKFSQISANPARFYGYLGGQGPVGREQLPIRILNPSVPNHPGDGYYSRTAWFAGFVSGSSVDIDEAEAPDWIVLIKAKIITIPDVSGVFNTEAWSDNPAYVARYLLSDARYFNEGVGAIEDAVCWDTGLHCAGYVLDSTKGEWTYVPQVDAGLHSAAVLDSFPLTSLVAHWKLDEASGTRADATSRGNNLTDNNTVTQAAGKIVNSALLTLANSEYLSLASNADVSMGDIDFTFAVWVYLNSKATVQTILAKLSDATADQDYQIQYDSVSDRFRFRVIQSPTTVRQVAANSFGSPSVSTWYHIVAWHDATANTINICVNNGTVDSLATGGALIAASASQFRLGAQAHSGFPEYLDGRLDEVSIWKRVLTSAERAILYNSSLGIAYSTALQPAKFSLYRSTGLVDSRRVRMLELGTLSGDPHQTLAEIEPFDPTDPPEPFDPPTNTNLRPTVLRVRHTCNVTLTERMSGLDFLHNVVAPSGRLFFRRNGKGRIEILTEKPADNTRLRAAAAPAATTVLVTDVDPWKLGPLLLTQKLLIGNTLTTSEVRTATVAAFTADGNSITLSSSGSGGITATASGANLTLGSATVAASGTITLSGTVAGTITVTINGLVCSYTLDSFDSLNSAAILLARYINATPKLNQFIKATYSGAVVTVTAKWGVLTLNSALANSHSAEVANPTVAPTLAAAAGGALPAGTWWVGYAYKTVVGSTSVSPLQSVVVTVNQKINVTGLGALPGGVLSVDWYVSKYAGSTEIVFWANNDGTAFSIGASVPVSSNSLPPDYNESGEEILRVAMSFSSNDQGATVLAQTGLTKGNIHAGSFKWPLPGKQSSTNLVAGTFFHSTEDYAPTPLEVHDYAHQTQIRKVNKKDADLSAFDNYSQSSRYLNFLLSKHREGDWFDSLSAGPYAMLLEEGDIHCGSSDNAGVINVVTRAEEISIGKAPTYTVKITGRKYSTLMFSDRVRQHSIRLPTTLRAITPIPSEIEFIDNFPIRDVDGLVAGFYVAVSYDKTTQGSWRGWQLWADYGDGYVQIVEGDVAAIMGTATTTLGTVTNTAVMDIVSTVTFTLEHGVEPAPAPQPFSTVTKPELLSSPHRNLFLVGNEYVQAQTVVFNGSQSYTISNLLRGRFGTDTTELTHAASERVVFLNGAEKLVTIDPVRLNAPFNYKAVTTNQDVSDATPVSFTWTGGTLRPLSPVNIRGARNAAGDLLIQWTRRTRIAQGLRDFSGTPLSEEEEIYQLSIMDGASVKRGPIRIRAAGFQDFLEDRQIAYSIGAVESDTLRVGVHQVDTSQMVIKGIVPHFSAIGGFEHGRGVGFIDNVISEAGDTSWSMWVEAGLPDSGANRIIDVYQNGALIQSTNVNSLTTSTSVAELKLGIINNQVEIHAQIGGRVEELIYRSPLDGSLFSGRDIRPLTINAIDRPRLIPRVSTYLYDEDSQIEDWSSVQDPVTVRIAQESAVVGIGAYATAAI